MDDAGHLPVLLAEVLALLAPGPTERVRPGPRVIVDCTVGLGGHAEGLLRSDPGVSVVGIDLDESNLLKTKERLSVFPGRVRLFAANFADVDLVLAECGLSGADGLLADLGVASVHLDQPERGFSFQAAGPLDMRLKREGPTAADLVNRLREEELADIIWRFGQERHSRRIARALVRARARKRIETTTELAAIVAGAMPRAAGGRSRIHPATRTFQAIRIHLNQELDNLRRLVVKTPSLLNVSGRAAVISFHSLEDAIVKQGFAAAAEAGMHRLLTAKPRTASPEEVERNPRSRSARLRALERIG